MTKKDLENEMTEAWFQSKGVYACMDVAIKYADQQTSEKNSEIERLKAELEKSKETIKKLVELDFNNGTEILKLQSELEANDRLLNKRTIDSLELQSELNKIKSKHVTEITSRNKRINDLESELNETKKQYSELCDVQKKLCEQNINLESELNELKEKHKRDVEDAFIRGDWNCCGITDTKSIDDAIQYYKQKFESND